MIGKDRITASSYLGELWQDGKGWILVVVSVGWFFSVGVRFAYPTLLPFFREEFAITLSTAGLLVSVLWMAYAIGQFPGGMLGDRVGEGNILVVSTVLAVVGITAVTLSDTGLRSVRRDDRLWTRDRAVRADAVHHLY